MSHDVLWDLKRHTRAKHEILQAYLTAWFPILGSAHRRVIFVDGFAGPGEYTRGEPGSPLVALEAALLHQERLSHRELMFVFVEEDQATHQHLESLIAAKQADGEIPPNFHYVARHGTFADEVQALLGSLKRNPGAPAFVMIDPFGVKGVPYEAIRELATYRRTELFISFMYGSMVRWMSEDDFAAHMDVFLGQPDWRDALMIEIPRERAVFLHDLFRRRLHEAGMEHVRSFEMIDDGGRTEYFLFFATHHLRGLEVMKRAMWSIDRSGAYRFSDATDPNQLALFGPDPDFGELRAAVLDEFGGRIAKIDEVEEFVTTRTRFLKDHLRKHVLDPLHDEDQIRVVGQRRRHEYPPETQLLFL